jgi:hypothetical protein
MNNNMAVVPTSEMRKILLQLKVLLTSKKKKVKISLLHAVEDHRVSRGQGSHIT